MGQVTNRLSEPEVRDRLRSCTDPKVIDEIYSFGQMMLSATVETTRILDSKAASMAAYGGAIVTLLVSTAGGWVHLGDPLTLALAAVAAISGFGAAIFAVRVMALRDFDWLGEEEWLEKDCLSEVEKLKRYRVLTMWGAMDSHKNASVDKVAILKKSQQWLSASVFFVLLTLLQVGWVQGLRQIFWMAIGRIS